MSKIPITEVVTDLRELFELNKEHEFGSRNNNNKFFIDKRQFERFEVINKLQNYFRDKVIDGGYLKLGSITFVYTDFEVLEGKPNLN